MTDKQLSTEEFFARLGQLFEDGTKAEKGSVFLTQKRLSTADALPASKDREQGSDSALFPDQDSGEPFPVLIRATNGKPKSQRSEKIKISTVVQPEELPTFYARYAEVCKSSMNGLKKRDRSGRKKAKAKKRKGAEATKNS